MHNRALNGAFFPWAPFEVARPAPSQYTERTTARKTKRTSRE